MNLTRDRVRSIGWAFVLTVCFALLLGLTFRVNAEKSAVRLAERRIVALKQEKMFLETEFLTRSNQQQLRNLNEVEMLLLCHAQCFARRHDAELFTRGARHANFADVDLFVDS